MKSGTKRGFGGRLRTLRKQSGKTLHDVAEALGVSVVYVSDIERGNRKPFGPEHIEKLAVLLNADSRELHQLAAEARGAFELPTSKIPAQAREFVAGLARGEQYSDDFWDSLMKLAKQHRGLD
jgi:transcriptional regulator with XRE-family HTH domain